MRTYRTALLILTTLLVLLCARADTSRLYTAESGLSSSKITCLVQDRYGFMWIGTEYGLNRFDGYRYTSYLHESTDSTSLPSDEVTCFLSDTQGRLWVGCNKGLARYDHESNTFVHYAFSPTFSPRVESIVETKQGDLLVGTAGYGLFLLRKGAQRLERLTRFSRNNADEFASRLFIDGHQRLWRASQQSQLSSTAIGEGMQPQRFSDYQLGNCGPVVKYISTREGLLLVCMYDIMRYDAAADRLVSAGYDLSAIGRTVSIRTALLANDGTLYLGTSGRGVMMAAKGSRRFTPMPSGNRQFDLSQANVNDLMQDKDGNLWVSCYNKGLYLHSSKRTAFFTQTFASQDIRLGSSVSSMAPADDGGKWVTVQKSGIYHFDRDGRITERRTQPSGANTIYRDRTGNYWLGTENALYAYDVKTGAATRKLTLDGWGVNCMADDGRGTLYVSNFGKGLVAFDMSTGATRTFSMNDGTQGHLPNDWVKSLLVDRDGRLWVGCADGLATLDPRTQQFTPQPEFRGQQCLALFQSYKTGDVFAGGDRSFYRIAPRTRQATPFNSPDGTDAPSVYGIVEDRAGDLWLSTAMGIWQLDHQTQKWIAHIGGSGLATREYVLGAALHNEQTDDVAFGIGDGITTFLPQFVRESGTDVPDAHLSRMVIGGKEQGVVSKEYVVDYEDNTLTLEFSLLTYHDMAEVTYQYRLKADDEWTVIPDGGNAIVLTSLEPGTHHLEVRATNGGRHSKNILQLTITVRHPWYSTPLAWTVYALLLVMLVALGIYWYERRRTIITEEAKMRFLINATHDIRSPLTLILGPLAKLKERLKDQESQDDIETIDRNAQRLLLLVNQILDERRIDKQQMRLQCEETDLVKQVQGVCSMYQYNAHQRHIRFDIKHTDGQLNVWIDRLQFDKVLANLLSNAFKYTLDGGEIIFTLEKTATHAILRLTDSGPGLREDKPERLFERFYQGRNAQTLHVEGTGIGLNLSRAIVQLHGGTITAYNRTDGQKGATFEVRLMLGHGHLGSDQMMTAAPQNQPKVRANRGQTVLIVDDDQELANYVATELSPWFKTSTCNDGKAALEKLLNEPFDLLISDVVMPEMDGLELLRNVKSNPRLSHIPVILLTSKSEADHRVEGLKKGADGYIAKPFNMEELHVMAVNLIDNVRRLRGKFSGAQQQADRVEHVEVKGTDDALMERIMRSLNQHLSDPGFKVDSLTADVGISRAQLHRKLKELTGLPAGEFIRNLRMDEAARLIAEGKVNVAQVAYAVGFTSQSHFSASFAKRFGMSPKEYAAKAGESRKTGE